MSERNENQPRRLAGAAVLALAAVAGAVAIYVTMAPDGNGVTETSAHCPANDALRAAVEAAATGEVAAVVTADPIDMRAITSEEATSWPVCTTEV